MAAIKTYTHVTLHEDNILKERYEIRVSTFIEFDSNPGRRAISGQPSKEEALEAAKAFAGPSATRREVSRCGGG